MTQRGTCLGSGREPKPRAVWSLATCSQCSQCLRTGGSSESLRERREWAREPPGSHNICEKIKYRVADRMQASWHSMCLHMAAVKCRIRMNKPPNAENKFGITGKDRVLKRAEMCLPLDRFTPQKFPEETTTEHSHTTSEELRRFGSLLLPSGWTLVCALGMISQHDTCVPRAFNMSRCQVAVLGDRAMPGLWFHWRARWHGRIQITSHAMPLCESD